MDKKLEKSSTKIKLLELMIKYHYPQVKLLDYLDKILEPNHASRLGGSNRGDIAALRNRLIFVFGAKTAEELGVK